jgi:cytoskeletal protein RodZ
MNDIGAQLRQAREARGLSLEQVHKATRVKRAFLEAIEAGRLEELPGPVQARGFVRSYAGAVGLDPDALLTQFDSLLREAGAAARRSPSVSPPAPKTSPGRSTLPLPLSVLVVGALILFAIGALLIARAFGREAPAPTPTLPASVPLSTSRTTGPTPAPPVTIGVSLTLTAGEHVWVRVSHDGLTAFEGILQPESSHTWQAQQQVIVETGNGAALSAAVNGRDFGLLGARGRVVVRAWGAEGEVTPAPTAAPAPPEPTPTPAA